MIADDPSILAAREVAEAIARAPVVIHPLRSGEKGGSFMSLTLPSGQTLSDSPKTQGPQKPAEKSPY